MLTNIQKFATSYANAPDGTFVVARLHSDASSIEVVAVNKENRTLRGVFDESMLTSLKTSSAPDQAGDTWCNDLCNALCNNDVNVTGNSVEVKLGSGGKVTFPLEVSPALHGQQILLEALLHSVRMK